MFCCKLLEIKGLQICSSPNRQGAAETRSNPSICWVQYGSVKLQQRFAMIGLDHLSQLNPGSVQRVCVHFLLSRFLPRSYQQRDGRYDARNLRLVTG